MQDEHPDSASPAGSSPLPKKTSPPASVRATWAAMRPLARLVATAGLLLLLVVPLGLVGLVSMATRPAPPTPPPAAAAPATPVETEEVIDPSASLELPDTPEPSASPFESPTPSPEATPTLTPFPSMTPFPWVTVTAPPTPAPTPLPTPPGPDPLLGEDGRLTVLLLGSDYRPAHPGNRTDAIMVVSIDPVSRRTAAFSIPRDTVEFPLPRSGRFGAKVNALYQYLHARTGDGGRAMKAAIERAFGIEVDYYVFIGFEGVRRLINAIGGVDVVLERSYYDPYYFVTPRQQGWGLPAGRSHLNGTQALIFARSRKGDNDFGRARRQQLLIMAVLDKVRTRGVTRLAPLLQIAARTVRTDLPFGQAPRLFEIIGRADLSSAELTVFGPTVYAEGRGGSSFALKLDACRRWIRLNFPPVRPLGHWPPLPTAPPTPIPTPPPTPPATPRY